MQRIEPRHVSTRCGRGGSARRRRDTRQDVCQPGTTWLWVPCHLAKRNGTLPGPAMSYHQLPVAHTKLLHLERNIAQLQRSVAAARLSF